MITVNMCRVIRFEIRNEPFVSATDLNEQQRPMTLHTANTPLALDTKVVPVHILKAYRGKR
jgi:hypothetical protein